MNQFELTLKYPSLTIEHGYLFKIANLYNIDLSKANHNSFYGDRFGAMESDINLDIVGLIHDYNYTNKIVKSPLIEFVKDGLYNWGYESAEIKHALKKIEGLK